MQWVTPDILDAVAAGLRRIAQQYDTEQAVYGLDAMDELQLHRPIQQSLMDAGFGVFPEQRYPSQRVTKRKSEGKRCDIVLTPQHRSLIDPEAEQTLFSPPNAASLESAYWLEVKTVAQHTTEGPFPHYSKELLSPVSKDVAKLAADPLIYHSGLLLVLFTESQQTAEHDLQAWELRCCRKGIPVAPPLVRHAMLTDRMGNGHMAVALVPVRRL